MDASALWRSSFMHCLTFRQLNSAGPLAVLYPALWTGEHFYERVCLRAITAIVNTGSAYLK